MSMTQTLEQKNRKLIVKLVLVVIGMFAFATLALPPLYDAFCDLTGLNGKVELKAADAPSAAASGNSAGSGETVRAQFTTKVDRAIPWHFESKTKSIDVVPGETVTLSFTATNLAKSGMSGRAVPSVTPAQATGYLRKMECFCFQEQYLEAGETKDMPLQFYFAEDIPEDIKEVTLSYTLYKMENQDGSAIN